jgi:hypothetical protein
MAAHPLNQEANVLLQYEGKMEGNSLYIKEPKQYAGIHLNVQ